MSFKISVVIPTYKRRNLLLRCMRSVCNQSMDPNDFEIIIVVDGRDDSMVDFINSFKKFYPFHNIKIYQLGKKSGPAAARNVGWKNADAPVIAFTDDDCIVQKHWLSNLLMEVNDYNEPFVFSGRLIVPLSKPITDYKKNVLNLETADFITANCCCTRIALEITGGFDEDFKMAWREDSDLHFKCIENNIPILKKDKAIVFHPVRNTGWAACLKEQKKTMYNALLFKKYRKLFRQKIKPSPNWHYYLMVFIFISMVFNLFAHNWQYAIMACVLWLFLLVGFTLKRLKGTSKSIHHITEMVITSAIIPFLSVYWTWYGAFRYKVLYI